MSNDVGQMFNFCDCRNETEVESKLIVSFLLPQLGYNPHTWHQEVTIGRIRLDFLVFALNRSPMMLADHSPLHLVIEAKSPKENLDRHEPKLKNYLIKLRSPYGLLTNGKELRVYRKDQESVTLIFQCRGEAIVSELSKIKSLIGREEMLPPPLPPPKPANQKVFPTLPDSPEPLVLPEQRMVPSGLLAETEPKPEPKPETLSKLLAETDLKSEPATETLPETRAARSPVLANRSVDPQVIQSQEKSSMKTIAVYHNKGGVGKTTTTVNLASALSKKGHRVLLIDLDAQANSTFAVGLMKFRDELEDDIKKSYVYHVIREKNLFPISEVVRKSSFSDPEFDVIPSHIDLMAHEFELREIEPAKNRLMSKLQKVEEDYDVVLIDTPPALNLYARIALISADYLLIPSDLKPFANEGLINVKNFVNDINEYRDELGREPLEVLGVLASKVATHARFVEHTLPKMEQVVEERYGYKLLNSRIFERRDISAAIEKTIVMGNLDIPDPQSVLDYNPSCQSTVEFQRLAKEISYLIGL